MGEMKRYNGADENELGEIFAKLVLKCLENKGNEMSATVQYDDVFLDVHFSFKLHKENGGTHEVTD